jgi:hypothetical protein
MAAINWQDVITTLDGNAVLLAAADVSPNSAA